MGEDLCSCERNKSGQGYYTLEWVGCYTLEKIWPQEPEGKVESIQYIVETRS